jgi:hypothetical protein
MENLELTLGTQQTTLEAYTELLLSLLYTAPVKSDAIFIHVNQDVEIVHRLAERAVELYRQGYGQHIVVNGLSREDAIAQNVSHEGFAYWQEVFVKQYNVPESTVLPIKPSQNTPQETVHFLELAKEHNWKNALFLAVPSQLIRAYLQMVALVQNHKSTVQIRFQTSHEPIEWRKEITKQLVGGGILKGTRSEHIREEVKRLSLYMRGCDPKFTCHATIEEGLEYLKRYL